MTLLPAQKKQLISELRKMIKMRLSDSVKSKETRKMIARQIRDIKKMAQS